MTNQKKIKALLKSRAPIQINNALIKALDFDDVRDFTYNLGQYGHTTDFTYRYSLTEDWQKHLRSYLKSCIEE